MRALIFKISIAVLLLALGCLWLLRPFGASDAAAGIVGFGKPFLVGWHFLEEQVLERVEGFVRGPEQNRRRSRRLDDRIRALELQVARLRSAGRENSELRALLALPPLPGWRCIIATVIARDPVTWNRKFRLDKGSRHGLVPGAAVLANGKIVGRITECTSSTAMATTIADPTCRFSVLVGAKNAPGVLSGRVTQQWHEAPKCLVEFLPRDIDYRIGDRVQTSGMGGTIPGGLEVGRVTSEANRPAVNIVNGTYAQVKVKPRAELREIGHVAVICPE